MPRFFGLSNNSTDFEYRFAAGDGTPETLHAGPWAEAEIYAIVEWMFEQSEKNGSFEAGPRRSLEGRRCTRRTHPGRRRRRAPTPTPRDALPATT